MHDDQVEDRLRSVLRVEGDALQLTITPDELERRLALRRRERQGRRLGLVAAAIGVVAIGSLAVASAGWFGQSSVGSGPSAEPTSVSSGPASPPATSPAPSQAARPCETIDPASLGKAPSLLVGVSPGDARAWGGLASSYRLGDRQVGEEGTWDHDSIGIEHVTAGFPTERIQVFASEPDACLVGIQVDARPSDGTGDQPARIADLASASTRMLEFDKPPTGDWFVRVHAEFATTSGAAAWSETFFVIDVPDCAPVDPAASDGPPGIGAGVVPGDSLGHGGVEVAAQWDGRTIGTPGTWDGLPDEPDRLWVEPTSQVVQIASDSCLLDVSAEALLTVFSTLPEPSPTPIPLQVVRGDGSRTVDIEPPPTGGWTVRIRAHFPTTDGSEAWSETLFFVGSLFDAPGLTVAPDFFEVMSDAHCPSYQLASGASAADSCAAPYEPIDGREPLPVKSGAPLSFRLEDGWAIDTARTVGVDADLVARGAFAPEYSVDLQENVGTTLTVPILLDPGPWIVRVSVNGKRQGDSFSAYYDIAVTVTP